MCSMMYLDYLPMKNLKLVFFFVLLKEKKGAIKKYVEIMKILFSI